MDKNKINAKKPASKSFNISNSMNQEVSSEFDNARKADTDKNKNTTYSTGNFSKDNANKSNERLTNEQDSNKNKNR